MPAGHRPGAAGFLFAVEDGVDQRTVLATGDFATRRAAGYPGLALNFPVDVDMLFLTAVTNDEFADTLTDAIGTLYERAHAGATVLATASGLTGLHVAYLLGHLAEQHADALPVTVVGHVATLYECLEYAVPER